MLARRAFSSTRRAPQARQKLRPSPTPALLRRPAFAPDSPFLPSTALVGTQWRPPVPPHQAPSFPILVPRTALAPALATRLGPPPADDPCDARQIAIEGQHLLHRVVEHWVRNELNVMGTIREETIQIFLKLVLHPSTLAPLAETMKLRTAGRRVAIKASQHAPRRLVPASTAADEELTALLHYLLGSLGRTLAGAAGAEGQVRRYIVGLLSSGLAHTSLRQLLLRAAQLSGQAVLGNRHGHASAEIRVAQLDIWGARRDTKIRKLVPDQLPHRTPQRLRKAALLKQRWRDEERKMVQWRARLLKVTAIQENEAAAEQLQKQEHALNVKQWRADRKKLASSSTAPDSPPSLLARLFNFWPFAPAPPAPPKSP